MLATTGCSHTSTLLWVPFFALSFDVCNGFSILQSYVIRKIFICLDLTEAKVCFESPAICLKKENFRILYAINLELSVELRHCSVAGENRKNVTSILGKKEAHSFPECMSRLLTVAQK